MIFDEERIAQWRNTFADNNEHYIRNVKTRLTSVAIGRHVFLTSINDQQKHTPVNAYVVSPITAFGHYALDEIKRLQRPLVTWPLTLLVLACRALLASGRIDNIVAINNWLLSTNIYPKGWLGEEALTCVTQLTQSFPRHAIGFRSLNTEVNGELLDQLLQQGFIGVPSRQVYIFDFRDNDELLVKHHNNRMDAKLLEKSSLVQCEAAQFSAQDYVRAEALYRDLYVNKYSSLNPQYTAAWLRAGVEQGWLELIGLRDQQGELAGVVGWFIASDTVTAPIVGYDTSLPKKLGLYRLLTHLCLKRAAQDRKRLNFSSGAAAFKRLRGGIPAIEYSAVYIRHLPFWQQAVWKFLSFLLTTIAVPLMRRWQL